MALIRETQRGTFWRVRGAGNFVIPGGGTRPGTVLATYVFNLVFRNVLLKIRARIKPLACSVREALPQPEEFVCANEQDWQDAQPDLSFVDDLT
eukprot:4856274-Pyramimonas_sp.AAC.1